MTDLTVILSIGDVQHNGTQHNENKHNHTQHKGLICDTQTYVGNSALMTFSTLTISITKLSIMPLSMIDSLVKHSFIAHSIIVILSLNDVLHDDNQHYDTLQNKLTYYTQHK